MSRPSSRPRTAHWLLLAFASALTLAGCLKSLDESLMNQTGGAAGMAGAATGGGGSGGAGGSGGSGGAGGSGGTSGDSGSEADAPAEGGIVAYDPAKFPVTNIGSSQAPVIIASDGTTVFRATKNKVDSVVVAQPLAGGVGTPLPTAQRPQALATTAQVSSLFVGAGQNTGNLGSLVVMAKDGSGKVEFGNTLDLVAGIHAASDSYVYVSLNASSANAPSLVRFGFTATTVENLYLSTTGSETGGDVEVAVGCVYWISNGDIFVITTTGGARSAALASPVTDAVGLAADGTNFYYTRADGSVWRRALSSGACDGQGAAETMLASGFEGIGDLIAYSGSVAWVAMGDKANGYAGGGVFSMPTAGGTITQVGPKDLGPSDIDQGPTDVVFATDVGTVRKVPKTPVN